MASWLHGEFERIYQRLRAEERERRSLDRKRALREQVAAFLAEWPDATANQVCAEIKGRRVEILAAVQELRGGQ